MKFKMVVGFSQAVGGLILISGVIASIASKDTAILVDSWIYGAALIGVSKAVQDLKGTKK